MSDEKGQSTPEKKLAEPPSGLAALWYMVRLVLGLEVAQATLTLLALAVAIGGGVSLAQAAVKKAGAEGAEPAMIKAVAAEKEATRVAEELAAYKRSRAEEAEAAARERADLAKRAAVLEALALDTQRFVIVLDANVRQLLKEQGLKPLGKPLQDGGAK